MNQKEMESKIITLEKQMSVMTHNIFVLATRSGLKITPLDGNVKEPIPKPPAQWTEWHSIKEFDNKKLAKIWCIEHDMGNDVELRPTAIAPDKWIIEKRERIIDVKQ